MKKIIIIPARLSSTRLENKVLMDLNGKTLIQRVFENAKKAKVSDVYIATDSLKIKEICKSFTKNIIITSNNHKTGTDRIAEASKNIDSDIVLNIQSDEPFINVETINKMIDLFLDPNVYMTSSMYKLSNKKEFDDALLKTRNLQKHRGPDNFDWFQNTNIALFSNRLNIIDLTPNANMPMMDEKTGCVIVFNGEVYNYKELYKSLDIEPYSLSDCEVIIHLYY